MFDVDVVIQQRFANRRARRRCDACALGAVFSVGEDGDGRHDSILKECCNKPFILSLSKDL
jgi:hypothetical protein